MNFKESIVFMETCKSMKLRKEYIDSWMDAIISIRPIFTDAKAYIGFDDKANAIWATDLSYYFFRYLMYGYERPDNDTFSYAGPQAKSGNEDPTKYKRPLSVKEAIKVFNYFDIDTYIDKNGENPDCNIELKTSTDEEIYLPANINITVNKI